MRVATAVAGGRVKSVRPLGLRPVGAAALNYAQFRNLFLLLVGGGVAVGPT